MDILILQETLLSENANLHSEFTREAAMRSDTDTAARGSALLVTPDLDYALVCKEIADGHEIIAIRVGTLYIVGVYIRIDHDVSELIIHTMEKLTCAGDRYW